MIGLRGGHVLAPIVWGDTDPLVGEIEIRSGTLLRMVMTGGRVRPAAPTEDSSVVHSQPVGDRPWAQAAVGAGLAGVLAALTHRALSDDAMITLSYARTFAETGTWGAEPGIVANTQTSPANALLLAALTLVTSRPVVAVAVLLICTLALTGWWAARVADELAVSRWSSVALLALLGSSPLLVGTVGLETYLGVAVLVGVARYGLAERVALTGALLGAAVLMRPDLAVPALVVALGVARASWRAVGVMAGVAAAVALPWHAAAWWWLGGFLPDTTWVKTMTVADGPTILGGPVDFMARYYPAATPLSALPVVAALACAVGWVVRDRASSTARVVVVFVAAGWVHLLALAAIGAAGMTWYYGPISACSAVAVALTLGAAGARTAGAMTAGVFGVAAAGVLAWGPVPWSWLPMVHNVAESRQYADIGRQLGALTGGKPVEGPGEVGALAFHSTVPVLDFLTDPTRTTAMTERATAGPVKRALMNLSAAHRTRSAVRELRWVLVFGRDPAPAGLVVRSWPVSTPVRGPDRVLLIDRGAG